MESALKYLSFSSRPRAAARSTGLPILSLLALTLAASGCASSDVEIAEAQPSEAVLADAAAASDAAQPDLANADASDAADAAADSEAAADADAPTETATASTSGRKYNAGEDPEFAARMGWPVQGPAPLAGALLPQNRIVCYYGNPNSTRMGALGEFPKDDMLRRLRGEVDKWTRADPQTPAKPCLHMVAVVAQDQPGTTGKYRSIMLDRDVQKVYDWAREVDGIFIVDIQVGTDDIRNILPRFEWILKNPDVHVGVDPEFYMKGGQKPGTKIGTMDAADINYITDYLAKLVREHDLPPKTLVVHRFTRPMVTNSKQIKLRPEVQIVMHMDGWGAAWLKRDSYRDYVVREPVQFTGFKIFYKHDQSQPGWSLMQPADLLKLEPRPFYIQYQ